MTMELQYQGDGLYDGRDLDLGITRLNSIEKFQGTGYVSSSYFQFLILISQFPQR